MSRKVSLETDLKVHKPKQDVILGLGLVKSTIFFIFSYVVLSSILKNGMGGLEVVFLGIVIIGTFYLFLRKYDFEEVEAYALYTLNSLSFRLFSGGVKKLNVIKDVREDSFIVQNGGLRAVIEVSSCTELSNESSDGVERLIWKYSRFLETFDGYVQLVVRIRKVPPLSLVQQAFGNERTLEAKEYLRQFSRHGVTSLKIYIVLAVDPPKWFYFEKYDEKNLKKKLEEKVSSCMEFLSREGFV